MPYLMIMLYVAGIFAATFFGGNFLLRIFEIPYELTLMRTVGVVGIFTFARCLHSFIFVFNHYEEQARLNELLQENETVVQRCNELVSILSAVVQNNGNDLRIPHYIMTKAKEKPVKIAHNFDYLSQEDVFTIVGEDKANASETSQHSN